MINNVVLAGRLVSDPELRHSATGMAIATFRLAVDRPTAKENEQQADFFNCVAFGAVADSVHQYCDKGMPVAIEGRIAIDQVQQEDGSAKYYTKIVANSVRFLESKAQADARRAASGSSQRTLYRANETPQEAMHDDPFGD